LGLGTIDHVLPFQDSMRVRPDTAPFRGLLDSPTAVQEMVETQDTPNRRVSRFLPGLGTMDHPVPFQDSIRAWSNPPLKYEPTAVQSLAVTQETPEGRCFHVPWSWGRDG
jgi:hypothetical protein